MMKIYKENKMNKVASLVLIVFTIIFISSCTSKPDQPEIIELQTDFESDTTLALSSSQFTSSDMKLGSLEDKPFIQIVKANGMFDVPPEFEASISSYFGGTVKNLQLITGERVKKGQVLFNLENPDFVQMQVDYLEAKGQLGFLKSEYDRQKALMQDNVTSQKNYLKSESEYNSMRIKSGSLSKKLVMMNMNPTSLTVDNIKTSMNVFSPINGYVTRVNVTRGSFLNPSELAMSIISLEHMHLELNIFEKDLAKVRVNQPINFKIQEDNSKVYVGFVHLINKTIDIEKRTIGIHGHLSDKQETSMFSPGMYVEAEIITNSENLPSLPIDAVVEVYDKYYVLVMVGLSDGSYSFVRRKVSIGSTNNGYIEILNSSEFANDAQFLISGAFNLIKE